MAYPTEFAHSILAAIAYFRALDCNEQLAAQSAMERAATKLDVARGDALAFFRKVGWRGVLSERRKEARQKRLLAKVWEVRKGRAHYPIDRRRVVERGFPIGIDPAVAAQLREQVDRFDESLSNDECLVVTAIETDSSQKTAARVLGMSDSAFSRKCAVIRGKAARLAA